MNTGQPPPGCPTSSPPPRPQGSHQSPLPSQVKMTSVPREPGSLYPQVWGSCPGVRVEPPRSKTVVGLWLSHLACYLLCERVRSQGLLLLLKHLRCPRDRGIWVALFISRRIFSYSDLGNNSTFSLVHLPRKGGSQTKAFWNLVGVGGGRKFILPCLF